MLVFSLSLLLPCALGIIGGSGINLNSITSALTPGGNCSLPIRVNTKLGTGFNSSEKAIIRQVFNTMDKDGDGELTATEIYSFYQQTGTPNPLNGKPITLADVKLTMRLVDEDDDGDLTLNFKETLALMALFDFSPASTEQLILRTIFVALDLDGDGFITISELQKIVNQAVNLLGGNSTLIPPITKEILEFVIETFDKGNLDGEVSMQEFLAIGTYQYYRQIFNLFDDDHDGKLDVEEIQAVFEKLSGGLTLPLFQIRVLLWGSSLDKNKNRKLEFIEFLDLLEYIICSGFSNPMKPNYGALYDLWDIDAPKGIDQYELQEGFKDYFNYTMSIETAEQIVSPTGRISRQRFIQFFKSSQQGPSGVAAKVITSAGDKNKEYLTNIKNMLNEGKIKNSDEINNMVITNRQIYELLRNYQYQSSLQTNINSMLLAGIFIIMLVAATKIMFCKRSVTQKYDPVGVTSTNEDLTV